MIRQQIPRSTKKEFIVLLLSGLMMLGQVLLFWLPVKKNRVMVYVHDRKGFTCNPKYIVLKLRELFGDRLEVIWVSMYPETCREVRDLGIRVLKNNSPEQFKTYLRTRFFITDDAFPTWALHRRSQKWMNTWHGAMNYKHIGYDYLEPMSRLNSILFRLKNRQPDFFLSGSGFFTRDTALSFRLDADVFFPAGLPRNDVLFARPTSVGDKVRARYQIAQERRIAIFAPTFRAEMKSDTFGMNFELARKALHDRFGGDWVILYRSHNFVKEKQNADGILDASTYHDMQELMCAADVLISDYSSCLFDFCMTGRPAFVYATDLDSYRTNDRSFAYPVEKWPYPVARSNEELENQIREFDAEAYRQRVAAHLADTEAYDDGKASERVAGLIERYCL